MKNLTGLFLVTICISSSCCWSQTSVRSEAQLYTLSDDLLNQKVSWTEFKKSLSEYKLPLSEENVKIWTSFLKKVPMNAENQKDLQCYQSALSSLATMKDLENCDPFSNQVLSSEKNSSDSKGFDQVPSLQISSKNEIEKTSFYEQKTFWVVAAIALGAFLLKDKEIIIEK